MSILNACSDLQRQFWSYDEQLRSNHSCEQGSDRQRNRTLPKPIPKRRARMLDFSASLTYDPRPTLALYDEKGQASGMIDDDSLTFIKSHVSLAGGVLSMGDQTSGLVISP
jgi:hypothetical protein